MSDADILSPWDETILELGQNPRLAHAALFAHRHHNETPAFHHEIVDLWHSTAPKVLVLAFRGAAKSTLFEEGVVLDGCYRAFHNALIIGETYERAVERLRSVKNEFEHNEYLIDLFGSLVGDVWQEGKIVLANGVVIQAIGRLQSLRGTKHLDRRPDCVFGDDLEDDESVATPEARQKTLNWAMSVLIPALDTNYRMRIAGTPLHPQSLLMRWAQEPNWLTRVYPIKHIVDGGWQATWPSRYPLDNVNNLEAEFSRLGATQNFKQEFMCEAVDPATKAFTEDMKKIEPVVRTWQAVYSMHDPARTTEKTTSATTGHAVWSWIKNRLVIWEAGAHFWKPDEIISDMFRVDEQYRPVALGVEEDGLNQFIMQPLRQEQLRRGYSVPIRALKAPKGKFDFIRGLQPFFKAGEVICTQDMPELWQQLLSFPTGRIDAPNALAYALRLRPGQAIYDNFDIATHVNDGITVFSRQPLWLALNATQYYTTAALVQVVEGQVSILWDTIREGDPGQVLAGILADAGLEGGQKPRLCGPPSHFGDYDTVGLRGAARKIPTEIRSGGFELAGREEVRRLLGRTIRSIPAFQVSPNARWTLNAFVGGFCKEVDKRGQLGEFPVKGPYLTLMEGIESFAALMESGSITQNDAVNYRYTPDGRRYISARG